VNDGGLIGFLFTERAKRKKNTCPKTTHTFTAKMSTGPVINFNSGKIGGLVTVGTDNPPADSIISLGLNAYPGVGVNSIFMGYKVGNPDTQITGYGNVCIGKEAGRLLETANSNTCIGAGASGSANCLNAIVIGFGAKANSNGVISIGNSAGTIGNPGGIANISIGSFAGIDLTSGASNVFVGFYAGVRKDGTAYVTGIEQTCLGSQAQAITGTRGAIAIGNNAFNKFGNFGTSIGNYSINNGTSGVAVGDQAYNDGNFGVAIGGHSHCEGDVAIGYLAETLGGIAIGNSTYSNVYSVVIGHAAEASYLAGLGNVVIGASATSTHQKTVSIGYISHAKGDYGIAVGFAANAYASAIAIGKSVTATANQTKIAGIRGATTAVADAVTVLIDSTGHLGTVSSSLKEKMNIRPLESVNVMDSAFEPKRFTFISNNGESIGLIAEEMYQVLPEIAPTDANGDPCSIRYDLLSVVLLKKVRELIAENETLNRKFQILETKYGIITNE